MQRMGRIKFEFECKLNFEFPRELADVCVLRAPSVSRSYWARCVSGRVVSRILCEELGKHGVRVWENMCSSL